MLCGYRVPVVLTSLLEPCGDVPSIRVFSWEGGAVREFTGATGGPLRLAEAQGILRVLLPATLAARKKFLLEQLATMPEVYGDDNHDDDDIVGDEDTSSDDEDYVPDRIRGDVVEASDRVLRGSGGAATSFPTSASGRIRGDDLYAELDEEVRIQRMRALIRRSPQIQQLMQRGNTAIH
jgi:hypothetical protein